MPASPPLRSEEVKDILTAVPSWMIRWGNSLVLALIVGVLVLSHSIQYPDVIPAEATVTTLQPPQKIYANVAGQVDTFLVTDQQWVEAGTPLAIMENTADFGDVQRLQFLLDTLLQSPPSALLPPLHFPWLSLGDIEADFALFENSYAQYFLYQQLQPFSNQSLAAQSSLRDLQKQLANLEAQQQLSAASLRLKQQELARYQQLLSEGLYAPLNYDQKKLEKIQLERDLQSRQLAISQTQAMLSQTQWASRETAINQTMDEKRLQRTFLQSIHRLQKAITAWKRQYVLSTDRPGQVSFFNYWTTAPTLLPGDLVFTILPKNTRAYRAQLKCPARNSGKLQLGQRVHIYLTDYPNSEFGTLHGTVQQISLTSDQEGFYGVQVAIPAPLITSYRKEITFKHDMQGIAEIITEELRLSERFFYQFKSIFSK